MTTHLLSQYDERSQVCRELHAYIYDVLQRHSNASGVGAAIRGNQEAFMAFTNKFNKPQFIEKIKNTSN